MGNKKADGLLAGLIERYARWRMQRLSTSNRTPLRKYLARLGLMSAYLLVDFVFLPSLFYDTFTPGRYGVLAFGALLVPVLVVQIKLFKRFS